MSDELKGPVVEFTITYFGMTPEQQGALLNFYARQAYTFTKANDLATPSVGSIGYATVDAWEKDA